MDDLQLKKLLLNNPEQGLGTAIELYGSLVKSIVQRIVGISATSDVEECTADVFVRLYQGIDKFDTTKGCSFKSYLCGIARHTALDYHRRLQKQPHFVQLDQAELGLTGDFADLLAKQQTDLLVQQAVDSLLPPDREIFILRYYFGEKIAVIAERLSLDRKTVENRLYRGRQKLKAQLMERRIVL